MRMYSRVAAMGNAEIRAGDQRHATKPSARFEGSEGRSGLTRIHSNVHLLHGRRLSRPEAVQREEGGDLPKGRRRGLQVFCGSAERSISTMHPSQRCCPLRGLQLPAGSSDLLAPSTRALSAVYSPTKPRTTACPHCRCTGPSPRPITVKLLQPSRSHRARNTSNGLPASAVRSAAVQSRSKPASKPSTSGLSVLAQASEAKKSWDCRQNPGRGLGRSGSVGASGGA